MEKARARRRWLLLLTVAVLPISLVPRELVSSGPGLAPVVIVLTALLAVRYRAFNGGIVSAVEIVAGLLAVWIAICLLPSPTPGSGQLAFREIGTIAASIVLFRLGRREELKPTILPGVAVGLALLLGIEAYQLAAGLPRLMAHGYTSENGYYYNTEAGSYRPFGTFTGPTTFGAYLAMLGLFAVAAVQRTGRRLVLLAVVAVAVAVTDTRSAVIGAAVVMVVWLLTSPRIRRSFAPLVFVGPPLVLGVVLLNTGIFAPIAHRLSSATSASDTSRATRTAMWEGIWHVVTHQHALVFGLGAQDFPSTLSPVVGPSVAALGQAHSNYFQELYRYGLPGMALFVALVVVLLASVWRGRREGVALWPAALAAVLIFASDSVFNNSLSSANFIATVMLLTGLGSVDLARKRQAVVLSVTSPSVASADRIAAAAAVSPAPLRE